MLYSWKYYISIYTIITINITNPIYNNNYYTYIKKNDMTLPQAKKQISCMLTKNKKLNFIKKFFHNNKKKNIYLHSHYNHLYQKKNKNNLIYYSINNKKNHIFHTNLLYLKNFFTITKKKIFFILNVLSKKKNKPHYKNQSNTTSSLYYLKNNKILITNIIKTNKIKNIFHKKNKKITLLTHIQHSIKKIKIKKENSLHSKNSKKSSLNNNYKKSTIINWNWPVKNENIPNYTSIKNNKNKSIDISGNLGQPILSVANGKVVYIGNDLKEYGNLIIIKHENHNYLSVYAHNEKILVNETDRVKTGQKIATMGKTETNKIKLHFSMYYKGKPINPLHYLRINK
ncbi:Murein hydrolase activator NlpD [Candidatus Westeberhardia cardiocondylae]|uniref:Murein hydrolase activator NlpD n=2 Tax=Candidatus Westeberhardia cardiocondylae TaxID=1594731 RepID=A0A0H5BX97_9ENTR|nr:Murein hydrolase activator NlpD [Candidatus Westeberhardia cardiocondylae]